MLAAAGEIALMLGYGAAMTFLKTGDWAERAQISGLAQAARAIEHRHDLERANQTAHEVRKAILGE